MGMKVQQIPSTLCINERNDDQSQGTEDEMGSEVPEMNLQLKYMGTKVQAISYRIADVEKKEEHRLRPGMVIEEGVWGYCNQQTCPKRYNMERY